MGAFSLVLLAASMQTACGDSSGQTYFGTPAAPRQGTFDVVDPLKVVAVIDGDTIDVHMKDKLACNSGSECATDWCLDGFCVERIRMRGVNSPELHPDPSGSPAQECADAARDFTFQRVGTHVDLVYDQSCAQDPIAQCRGGFGRLLGYVQNTRGQDLGALLIARGLAKSFAYQNENFDRRAHYESLEQQAQDDSLAIWGPGCP